MFEVTIFFILIGAAAGTTQGWSAAASDGYKRKHVIPATREAEAGE